MQSPSHAYCQRCNEQFSSGSNLFTHIVNIHYFCVYCKRVRACYALGVHMYADFHLISGIQRTPRDQRASPTEASLLYKLQYLLRGFCSFHITPLSTVISASGDGPHVTLLEHLHPCITTFSFLRLLRCY